MGTHAVCGGARDRCGWTQGVMVAGATAGTLHTVDVIVASLNRVFPGARLGEVTPEIVQAILGARATKVLLPLNRVRLEIVGARACTLEALITESLSRVRSLVSSTRPA